jgi:hypothetical protein
MSRKLKVLLLTTIAMAAMAAFTVASAYAGTEFENPSSGNTRITSTPDGTGKTAHHLIDTPAGSITCSTANLVGTISKAKSAPQVLEFEYANCTYLGVSTTVAANGCFYVLGAEGNGSFVCSNGQDIEFEAAGCTVKIHGQAVEGFGYTNINSGTELTLTMSIKSIRGTAAGCAWGNGPFTTGEYTTGNTILTGEEDSITSPAMKPFKVS